MERQEHLRGLDPAEYFFWLADRVSCRNFVILAEVEGDMERLALDDALARFVDRYAALRLRFHADPPVLSQEAPRRSRVRLTEGVAQGPDWRPFVEAELSHPFPEDASPPLRCALIRMPAIGATVLALTVHHSLADGRSAVALMRALLGETIGGAAPAAGHQPLLPPLHSLFPEGKGPSGLRGGPGVRNDPAEARGRLARLTAALPRPKPRLETIALDPEATRFLRERCRAEGATVQGALGAAQLLASRAALGSVPEVLLLTNAVDMRRYLRKPVPQDQLGLYTSLLSASYEVPGGGFWSLARRIAEDLRRQIARGEAYHFYSLARLFFSLRRPDAGPDGRDRQPSHSMLTNVGVVPDVEGGGRVRAIAFALAPMPSQLSVCAASTYGGRLLATLGFDSGVLPRADAQAMAGRLKDVLETAAGGKA